MNRILLVDDDEIFRKALQKNLENLGFEVNPAQNGKEAVEVLQRTTFDLVISDIRMPEMDGIELTKYIKANLKLPIILITGFAEILETHED